MSDENELIYDSRLDAFELYHLIVENQREPSRRNGGPALPALGHALAGSAATATSKLLIYPLDLVIARLQVQKQLRNPSTAHHPEYKSILDAAHKIYHHEGGLSAFYTGCLADVSKGIADSFLFFLAYSFLQQREQRRAASSKQQMTVAKEMGIGIIAGSFAKFFTTPLQNIITRQQTAALLKAKDTEADEKLKQGDALTVTQIARQIYKERGLSGFWAGYSLSLILTLNPAITFAVDNFLHKVNPVGEAGAYVTFLIAAISKAVATSITYPVSVAKSRAQATPYTAATASQKDAPRKSRLARLLSAQYAVLLSFQRIYKTDGLAGLYSGLEGEVLKGFISHGLTMMIKDRAHASIIELYYLLLKLTQQWPQELRRAQALTASVVVDARRKVGDLGESAVEAGKHAISDAESTAEKALDSGKQAFEDARERASNVGTSVLEGSKHAVADAKDYTAGLAKDGQAVLGSAAEKAENISVTLAESGKQVSSNLIEISQNALNDAKAQAGNISTSVVEAGRSAVGETAASRVDNIATTIVEAGHSATDEAVSRADNVGSTVLEAGKSVAAGAAQRAGNVSEVGKNLTGDIGQRAENIGVTIVEAGKSAIDHAKKTSE